MGRPTFLDLPERPGRPRSTGLTVVIDGGVPVSDVASLLASMGAHVDVWKLGWGGAYLDPAVAGKLSLVTEHGITGCVGGTLIELAARAGRVDECLAWASESGFAAVEVSNGLRQLTREAKSEIIARATRRFTVVAEIGAKDETVVPNPSEWAAEAADDLAAGASLFITEGRESGTVGLFDPRGAARLDVLDAVLAVADPEVLVFEAPRREQQAWFIARFGPNVNLANIAPRDVLGLEALRLGLRADTAHLSAPVVASDMARS
ncbi:MAG: phosphosulfolactate synthase [Acidimicrobiales bacterium]